jgi:TolB protein
VGYIKVKRGLRQESRLATALAMSSHSLDTPYRGGFLGAEHHFALSVYFEDTDAYGIVYYANYLKFMERARSDMIRAVGVDQAEELKRSGSAYAVVEVDIKYRRPARKGFVIGPNDWRRAAHKCSGLAYTAITGAPGMFDTEIAYVAQSGVGDARFRRIAVMDSDGYTHHYVTGANGIVLTPRLAPKGGQLAYVSFAQGKPNVRVLDLGSGRERPLLPAPAMTFAPRYSLDGSRMAFSMMLGSNSDIYVVGASGGAPQRLTTSPGVDTDPSFSPDGGKIVFESDRSGSQQLYVMNADGTGERRISFGSGRYASPVWSPDGQWIAFTHRGADGRRIGIVNADGTGERMLTTGPGDEGPAWAASSREILFERANTVGRSGLYRVALDGGEPRQMTIPQDGSDPDWSGVMD